MVVVDSWPGHNISETPHSLPHPCMTYVDRTPPLRIIRAIIRVSTSDLEHTNNRRDRLDPDKTCCGRLPALPWRKDPTANTPTAALSTVGLHQYLGRHASGLDPIGPTRLPCQVRVNVQLAKYTSVPTLLAPHSLFISASVPPRKSIPAILHPLSRSKTLNTSASSHYRLFCV